MYYTYYILYVYVLHLKIWQQIETSYSFDKCSNANADAFENAHKDM